jgi:hypothetical protein
MNTFGAGLMLIVSPVRTFMNISISNVHEDRNTFFLCPINKGISRMSKNAECPFTSSLFQAFF